MLGLCLVEFSFSVSKRAIARDEERDRHFPAWRRLDQSKMKRLYVYPMALTIAPLRIEFIITTTVGYFLLAWFSHHFCYCGKREKKGCMNTFVQRVLGWTYFLNMLALGIIPQKRFIEADYSEWLGPNYLRE